MTTATPTIGHLEVTVAHHGDNEFYMLGRIMPESGGAVLTWNAAVVRDVAHEVPPPALFDALPHQPCARDEQGRSTCQEWCIMLDACDKNGDVIDDKEIDAETADLLLDGEFSRRLTTARGELSAHYEYERHRPVGVSSVDWLMRRALDRANWSVDPDGGDR